MASATHRSPGRPAQQRKLPRVGVVGAGRVGSAIAWHCHRLGYELAGVTDKSPKQAWVVYGLLKTPYRRLRAGRVAGDSDVLFLTTPDSQIEPVFIALRRRLRRGTVVVHCSGVKGTEAFKGAEELGIDTLALHPIQSFSSHVQAIRDMAGCFFALEGTARGLRLGRRLVKQLRGRCVVIRGEDRPLYHAMCVFASNFQNALLDAAEGIGVRLGISRRRAARMLAPLARTVGANAAEYGAVPSLTGPVQRGDVVTVARHLEALGQRAPELLPVYRHLSLRLLGMATRQGLGAAAARRLRRVLEQEA